MRHDLPQSSQTLGVDLRALRRARGLTLAQTAQALGRSVGWLSQVERDKSDPSITDLRQIAAYFEVPVSILFRHEAAPAHEAGFIVRSGARRPMGSSVAGLLEELLSPDLTDDFEMVHSTFQPHSCIKEAVQRPTQEVGYVISGTLEVEIGGTAFSLNAGDSFRIRGEPFRWANRTADPAVAIWVIAPPVY
ncbi:helix-turn-helix domain-containing protein [uncultured Sulfitobacter sp.]|uniref:helix-turn-helix domain-containing protein n=1 Tax=uncultured Sulfitobacter sp. TaxID=191468 RepID=UPI0026160313|nr:helix-turn-helix domain-containing protein [uncultured Sulfitobacter sp.]